MRSRSSRSGSRLPTARRSTSSSRRALEDGTRIRLAGKGEEGPGGRGDAIVTIEIAPHRFFTRDGNNIRLELPVTLKEAVLGAKVKVPTPEGPVMLTVPKGTSSGKVLRLKGRGFAAKDGKRGDQLVTVEIDVPADDAELQQFAEGWSGGGNPRACLGRLEPLERARSLRPNRRKSGASASRAMRAAFGTEVEEKLKPRLTAWEVVKRVAIGVYNDGFIHAGNLAYLSIVALFPFFIVAAAVAHLLGQSQDAMLTVTNILRRLPPDVAATLARADPGSADGAHRHPALARRDRRAVDRDQLHRDDPRHPSPRLWREILRAVLGISARLDADDPRRGAAADARLRGRARR